VNAEEIRKLNEICQKKCLETLTVSEHKAGLESVKVSILTEIAAQLAEHNVQLKRIADAWGMENG
jgi:Holliday junction resolvasome RuvABC ATP-dependent DNA helicase subunit